MLGSGHGWCLGSQGKDFFLRIPGISCLRLRYLNACYAPPQLATCLLPSESIAASLTCRAELLLGLQPQLLKVGGAWVPDSHTAHAVTRPGAAVCPHWLTDGIFLSAAVPCLSSLACLHPGCGTPLRLPIQAVIGIPVLWALVNGEIGKHLQRRLGEDQVLLLLAWIQR